MRPILYTLPVLLRLAACLAIAPFVSSCEPFVHSCNEAGCIGGVSLSVAAPRGWQQGTYELRIVADDGTTHGCSFGVVVHATETELSPPLTCSPGLSTQGVHILGCPMLLATDAEAPDVICPRVGVALRLSDRPRSMRVQLERDGISLLDESITPEYRTSRPNGEDCPPTCHLADVALSVK